MKSPWPCAMLFRVVWQLPEIQLSNRVVRQYPDDSHHFARVALGEEDETFLRMEQESNKAIVTR